MSPLEWDFLLGYARHARRRLPRLPLLSDRALPAAVFLVAGCAVIAPLTALEGAVREAVALVSADVLLAAWCVATVMDGHWREAATLARLKLRAAATWQERADWDDGELDALEGDASLEGLLGALPQTWHERWPS